jgi:hypothetical protein
MRKAVLQAVETRLGRSIPAAYRGLARAAVSGDERAARRLRMAAARDKRAAAATEVATRILRARRGDTGPAVDLVKRLIARSAQPQLAGKFGKKLKKGLKKATLGPLKVAHKITHGKNSPIRKAELALQKTVGKALPFTKPFIKVHNTFASKVHKVVEKKTGLAKKAGKQAVKAQAAKVAQVKQTLKKALGSGVYKVTLPSGKTVSIAANRVVK